MLKNLQPVKKKQNLRFSTNLKFDFILVTITIVDEVSFFETLVEERKDRDESSLVLGRVVQAPSLDYLYRLKGLQSLKLKIFVIVKTTHSFRVYFWHLGHFLVHR